MSSTSNISIRRAELPPTEWLTSLVAASGREGYRFVERLAEEAAAGTNRFNRAGEGFWVAESGVQVAGLCGLNVDPYADHPRVGRVRRLYVLAEYRGRGIGQRLLQTVIDAARDSFSTLRVRTENAAAARLYERLGFVPATASADSTHVLALGGTCGATVVDSTSPIASSLAGRCHS